MWSKISGLPNKLWLKNIPENTALFFNQMEMYESVNTNFHSGNLLEHSIWSLFFVERICQKLNLKDIRFIKLCAIAALVHDIGKMDPFDKETVYNINKYFMLYKITHPSDIIILKREFHFWMPMVRKQMQDLI